jgi:GH15 family glucan-1,4-alpha-glucosidase
LPTDDFYTVNTESPKIQDYAVIGNGRSAALLSNRGSIDWLCWPRFDSPSIFGALLDRDAGGAWTISPLESAEIERRYIDNSNVLETQFRTSSGTIVLTDFMPVTSEQQKKKLLWPEHEIIRRAQCNKGDVHLRVRFDPRPDCGRCAVVSKNAGSLGLRIGVGTNLLMLRSDVTLIPGQKGGLSADVKLKAGGAATFSLTFSTEGPAIIPPLGDLVEEKLRLTTDWWRHWAAQAKYDGPYREQVIRSALVLKLLSFAPSGALVAAATTSLPERVGGDLNWDYRFCWLRDAAFAVRALFELGYTDDAEAFVSWLLHATRLTRPELNTLYDVYGCRIPREKVLSHLSGYAGSRPVLIGNAASTQLQLDVYGEVVEAVSHFFRKQGRVDRETQQMLRQYGDYVCRHWREPDNGMWESRRQRQHYTHSRLLCWVALDRLIDMQKHGQLKRLPPDRFAENRALIRREIEERGWNPVLQAYTQVLEVRLSMRARCFLQFMASKKRVRRECDRRMSGCVSNWCCVWG